MNQRRQRMSNPQKSVDEVLIEIAKFSSTTIVKSKCSYDFAFIAKRIAPNMCKYIAIYWT